MNTDLVATFGRYLSEVGGRRARTVRRYVRVVRCFETNYIGPVSDASREDLLSFLRMRQTASPAASSWNIRVAALKAFFKWAFDHGHVLSDPSEHLPRETPRVDETSPLSFTEMLAMVDAARSAQPRYRERNVALVLMFLHTGLRVAEVVALDVDQVDLANHELLDVTVKGGRRLTFAINDVLHEALEDLLEARPDSMIPALFLSDRGTRLSVRSAQATVRALAKRAGVLAARKPVSPHVLRHSFATGLGAIGVGLPSVQQALAHTSASTTERYVHLGLRERHAAVNEFGAHWRSLATSRDEAR